MPRRNCIETGHRRHITEEQKNQADEFFEKACCKQMFAGYLFMKKGLRVSDACSVRLENIDFNLRKVAGVQIKTGELYQFYLDDYLYDWLRSYILLFRVEIALSGGWVCFARDGRIGHVNPYSFNSIWKAFRDEYGYDHPYYIRVNGMPLYDLSNHVLRRRAINIGYEISGHDLRVAKAIAGHKQYSSTFKYFDEAKPDQVKKISQLIN